MDINHIQRSIIAGSVAENQYQRVSFLQPKDFNEPYSEIWSIVVKAKGDLKKFYHAVLCRQKFSFDILLATDYTHIEIMALILLEYRFRQYLEKILTDHAVKSDKATEGLILAQTLEEVQDEKIDVFDLIDQVPEYLKPYISTSTHNRLIQLQKYVETRATEIKKVTA